ncbi:hypothetical protein KI387_011107, partial [Taxus chinensis]
ADAGLESLEPQTNAAPNPNPALLQDLENLKQEVEKLESKAHSLELTIEDKNYELRNKESTIDKKEKLIEENSKTISSLKIEVEALQKKGTGDLEAKATEAYEQVADLEKQVDKLKESLEQQKLKQESLESRAREAVSREKELSVKFEKLQKVVTEQKARIQKAEQALQFAETTMLKAQAEAKVKAEEIKKVHGAWLPPWLAVRMDKVQAFVTAYWAKHGKPAMQTVLEKASEKAVAVHDWAKPHIDTAKTSVQKWTPVVKKQWQHVIVTVSPHMEAFKVKVINSYEVSRETLSPHLVKAQELLRPHVQTVKDLSGPYIDQVASIAQPHIDKAKVTLQPYQDQAIHAYRRSLTTATDYHHQLQGYVRKRLKQHELTAAFATKELVWFLASALLALPVLGMFMVYSSIFSSSKKVRKHVRSGHAGNANRKHKRRHVD